MIFTALTTVLLTVPSGSDTNIYLRSIPCKQVQTESWLHACLESCASRTKDVRRLKSSAGDSPNFRRLDKMDGPGGCNTWGADYPGRWLEAVAFLQQAGFAGIEYQDIIARLLRQQQSDGHFYPNRDGATYWGDHRGGMGLIGIYFTLEHNEVLKSLTALADFYVASLERNDFKALSGIEDPPGMLCAMEPLAWVYQLTGNPDYLKTAKQMADYTINAMNQFEAPQHVVAHSHSVLTAARGLAHLYRITGEARYLDACERLAAVVAKQHEYVSGGIPERFPEQALRQGDETCSTSDWLRLNIHLWQITGKVRYLDTVERIIFNHLPFEQLPDGGFVGTRDLRNHVGREWHFCCNFHGTIGMISVLENIFNTRSPVNGRNELHVNLLLPASAEVKWDDQPAFRIIQETAYPREGTSSLHIETSKPIDFDLVIHLPKTARDCGKELKIAINGKSWDGKWIDGYSIILSPPSAGWENGSTVTINFPVCLRPEKGRPRMESEDKYVFWHGPILLAHLQSDKISSESPVKFRSVEEENPFRLNIDRSAKLNTPLQIANKTYAHGLGTHAISEVVFDLTPACKIFKSEVGIDRAVDTESSKGSAVFIVKLGRKTENNEWQIDEVFRTGVMNVDMEPVPVQIELGDAQRLFLQVDDGGDGYAHDHADWAEAEVILTNGTAVSLSHLAQCILIPPLISFEQGQSSILNNARLVESDSRYGFVYQLKVLGENGKNILLLPLAGVDASHTGFRIWF